MPHFHDPAEPHSAARRVGRAFAFGIAINIVFALTELVFGFRADSTALLADAAHNFGDVLGLVLAWGATALARRAPSTRHTYGLRRATVLAALANAVLLIAGVGAVTWEAIGRLSSPISPHSATMMWVAAVGVCVNLASALLFLRGGTTDLNVRGAFLHLAADAAVSAGVVIAGAALWKTGRSWIDPVTGLFVSAVILVGTWKLLRDALHLALDGVPEPIALEEVRAFLQTLPDVEQVHDLHVWAMSTTEVALTAHLVVPWRADPPPFFADLEQQLTDRFGIVHATVQIEPSGACAGRRPDDV